jgi:hypothetical protein
MSPLSMVAWAVWLLFLGALRPAAGIKLESCSVGKVNMELEEDEGSRIMDILTFECTTDADLFLTSNLPGGQGIQPVPSTAGPGAVAAALNGTNVTSNFAKLVISDDRAIPGALFGLAGNVALECGEDSFLAQPKFDPPADFLFMSPPVSNPIGELWQAFGSYKFDTPAPKPRTIAFFFLANPQIEQCIDQGQARVKPAQHNDTQIADPLGSCEGASCAPWKYADQSGTLLTHDDGVIVKRRQLKCDVGKMKTFMRARAPKLFELFESATNQKMATGAVMTYTAMVNNDLVLPCFRTFNSLYNKTSQNVTLKGVRACLDPDDNTDPCCNEALRWGDCCLPKDKTVQIPGQYGGENEQAIKSLCGSNAGFVTALLREEISEMLISAQHPEMGCDAKARKKTEGSQWRRLTAFAGSCWEQVFYGRSKIGEDKCSDASQCWSGSCVSEGRSKRCASNFGEAAVEPLLKCTLANIDKELWEYLVRRQDLPSRCYLLVDRVGQLTMTMTGLPYLIAAVPAGEVFER